MAFYTSQLSLEENLQRGILHCDIHKINEAITIGADVNHNNTAVLALAVESDCNNNKKEAIIDLLLNKGAKIAYGINSLLTLTIINGDIKLIDFALSRIKNPGEEGFALLHALNNHNCEIAVKLLNRGITLSPEIMQDIALIAYEEEIINACNDIYKIQNLNLTLATHSDAINNNLISIEQHIISNIGCVTNNQHLD